MSLADVIYQKSLDLPTEKAAEVIDFIDFIKSRSVANDKLETPKQSKSLYQLFSESGLIGCIETDEQLSTTYKDKLDFSSKHGSI